MNLRKKSILTVLSFLLIASVIFIGLKYQYYVNNRIDNENTKQELADILKQNQSSLSLKDQFTFNWSEAYVFEPYTPTSAVQETVNKKWISPETSFFSYLFGIESNELVQDTQKRIVFVNNGKVIKDFVYNKSEFDLLDDHLKRSDQIVSNGQSQYKKTE